MKCTFVLLILTLPTLTLSAAGERLDIVQFTEEALKLDVPFQTAKLDEEIAELRWQAVDNLYRGTLEASPYFRKYDIDEPVSVRTNNFLSSDFEEQGLNFAYTQFLPLGTRITLGTDQIWENTRQANFAKEHGYSVSLIQPLWRNSFGLAGRLNRESAEVAVAAQKAKTRVSHDEACDRAVTTYIEAWTQIERARFTDEIAEQAADLFKKSEPSFKQGQIGRLDWWGVQSEHLNLQKQQNQARQRLTAFRLRLVNLVPAIRERQLTNPEEPFQRLLAQVKSEKPKTPTDEELYYQKLYQAQLIKTRAEKSNALPDLDLKLSRTTGDGTLVSERYKDVDTSVSLNLTWQINDTDIHANQQIAGREAERALLKNRELARVREDRFIENVSSLTSQAEQIQLEKQRVQILSKITDEQKRRFVQGRIDFQDFLRVREQWFSAQTQFLDLQANYWAGLSRLSLQENFPIPFCKADL
jgi:outer membrane protein TolC